MSELETTPARDKGSDGQVESSGSTCCETVAAETNSCNTEKLANNLPAGAESIRGHVQAVYGKEATSSEPRCDNPLYDESLLAGLPNDVANFTVGSGNPIKNANLQPGESVLDLGSGGGLDCFLAAKQVGENGKVIGLDMTDEMLNRARAAAKKLEVVNV